MSFDRSFDRRHVLVEPDDCQRDDGHHRRQDVDGQVLVPEHNDADGEGRQAAADAEDLGHVGRWRHLWKNKIAITFLLKPMGTYLFQPDCLTSNR